MKNKILCFFYFLFLYSCSERILGPNYNSHSTHNATMLGRNDVVNKEDLRMKKSVTKARKSAVKSLPKTKKVRKKKGRKFVN